ncbi:hypothetical protein BH11PLA1_BH11PLA1_15440 [soil metagenome]
MTRACMLMALAGAMISGTALGQAMVTLPGPYAVGPETTFHGIDVNGPSLAAGTYTKASLSTEWTQDGLNGSDLDPIWQSDQRFALHNADASGSTTILGGATYGGGTGGYLPTTALDGAVNGTIVWSNQTLTAAFTPAPGNALWLNIRNSYPGDGGAAWTSLTLTLSAASGPATPVPCPGGNTEVEPNDSKGTASVFTSAAGAGICGTTTGTAIDGAGAAASADYFKVTTAAHAGVSLHVARLSTNDETIQTLSIIGSSQDATGNTGFETTLQATTTVGTQRTVQWYTLGNSGATDARSMYVKVTGSPDTNSNYNIVMDAPVDVTISNIARPLTPGAITITTVGQTGVGQADTDLWVYDSNLNAIDGFGNDDEPTPGTTLGSKLTRTYSAGTYYLALGMWQMSISNISPSDERYKFGSLTDFPGTLVENRTTTQDRSFKITDGAGDVVTPAFSTAPLEILFYKLVVGGAVTRCQPADIADDQGNPLPSMNPNNGVNEGDYNAFFNNFFTNQAVGSPADIASDDGTPLPPFGPAGNPNNGVNEGDYNAFFNNFFNGCP